MKMTFMDSNRKFEPNSEAQILFESNIENLYNMIGRAGKYVNGCVCGIRSFYYLNLFERL